MDSAKLFTLWNKFPDKLRFLFIGGINTSISYFMFLIFLFFLGKENYQLSLALSWALSSFISFILQKTLVFQTKGNWLVEYIKCLFTWAIAYIINALLLELVVAYYSLSPAFGQIIAIFCTTIFTYMLFKYFAFKKGASNE